MNAYDLTRFLTAQEKAYAVALQEIKSGRKQSHWMWYIFPQFAGLGISETSRFYAINSLPEARAYLCHSVLGSRLKEICQALLRLNQTNPGLIFGYPDNLKLLSCMTLFSFIDESQEQVFKKVIDQYFNGKRDERTLRLIS